MYDAVIIGSGFSGLCMAIALKKKGIHNFIILEKAERLGGTWRENTYPGAECDIPSALYSYSFEPYTKWEYKWSHQDQILEYLDHCADKYELLQHIHFNEELTSANWNEQQSVWEINTASKNQYTAKSFVPAIGQLHHPSTPTFKNQAAYQNPSFHSAQWDHSISLENKTIGVIGNAASAVQFIPQIAKKAGKLLVFQRSANWMLPKQDRAYKEWEKKLVARFPVLLKAYRLKLWLLGGGLFFLMKQGNEGLRKVYQKKTIKYIKEHIKDEALVQKLIPLYPMGAKRILFSDDYYEALAKENVDLIDEGIDSFTPNGILTKDGKEYSCDILIYSTGFVTNPFLLNLEITGKNKKTIKNAWTDGPKNYLGITVSGFPNLFLMYGPNTNLGHNSIILMSEAQANYISKCIHEMKQKEWKSIDVKPDVIDDYHHSIQKRLQEMIWAKVDQSWYQSANGNIPNNWPGRTMEYMKRTKNVNFSDYIID